jgi:6-phosphogluconolactonase
VADRFVALANETAAHSPRFTVALRGDSTPKALYSLLAKPAYNQRIPWTLVHFFWGDGRCVPPEHPESDYRMVRESLSCKVTIPAENIHRMAGEQEPRRAAVEYEKQLTEFCRLTKGEPPPFDLILLGLGEEGIRSRCFREAPRSTRCKGWSQPLTSQN